MHESVPPAPAGFRPMRLATPVPGPFYGRREEVGFTVALRVLPLHCNFGISCQGGALMTLADMAMGLASNLAIGEGVHNLPTVSLNADFLAPAPVMAWVAGHARVLRRTKSLAFSEVVITTDGEPCLRAASIFKLPRSGAAPQFASIEMLFTAP
jgi:acyl-coenzyme A thioesterase PaaI-like protein